MKPTNSPTQGEPNPRKIMFNVVFGPLFHSKLFSVGWDWFYIGNRLHEPNPTKFSANTLLVAIERLLQPFWDPCLTTKTTSAILSSI